MKFEIPESLSRSEYKRKFRFAELYRSFVFAPRAMLKLRGNKKSKLVDLHFIERLQLAVTEVNGCAACSYAHTRMALREGMSNEEISSFLGGGDQFIQPEEAKAILFAQHFADSRGYPKKDAYEAILKEYGATKARIILSAVQMMIAGNMYGIPFSAYLARRKGKPFKESKLGYELGMMVGGILVLPIAFIHALVRWMFGLPNTRFDKSQE
jgi:AhpD family alkylhydroperoxidase